MGEKELQPLLVFLTNNRSAGLPPPFPHLKVSIILIAKFLSIVKFSGSCNQRCPS